ncbi:tRNA pseudouridine synthase B [Planktothrix sp. PCC 11201]|uniref:tRNA pseudouridine(55) synthase TruB n=1 Tax=Planktothrix sp. PCC 11201 TaxID=1729650 RepID=UPI000911D55F|nr:tRNA pseudouridine(55) synthase TruB [Planktothrix sp. PCC 11201]SKB12539.1 tRNA pseudouridine synthase B [Planktothrix sp. PCC 11201]
MYGFLNLNKSAGFTSHDCVARVRRILKLKRVGHAGTLDPAATGVLPMALGKATRLLQFLPSNKAYHAKIKFGVTTTTDDLEGETLTVQSVPDLQLEQIQAILPQFIGKIEQIPPIYSAIQVQGKRLYDLARKGEIIEVPSRTVEVFDLKILNWYPGEFPELEIAIACGSGTYIRSIARDLGAILNTGATLANLIRTQSSGFDLENSLTLETLETQVQEQTFSPLSPTIALNHLTTIILNYESTKRWFQGQSIVMDNYIIEDHPVSVYDQNNQLLGIGKLIETPDQILLAPQVVLTENQPFF